jgi:hypothetical protein
MSLCAQRGCGRYEDPIRSSCGIRGMRRGGWGFIGKHLLVVPRQAGVGNREREGEAHSYY